MAAPGYTSGPNLKSAGSGALKGAAMGSVAGPWGALGGAIIGGIGGLLDGGGGGGGSQPNPYKVNESNFQSPSGGSYFNPSQGQAGGYWANQAEQFGTQPEDTKYVDWNRKEGRSSRGTQEAGLQMLGQYASGNKSAARLASAAQRDATMAQIQSQMASAAGGYNPALQARGISAVAGAGQQMAGQTAAAAAQEQLAAQKAYLQATGQMRGQDISSQMAEQQWYQQQMAAKMAYGNLKAKYLALGLQEKDADRRAKMEMEKLKFMASEGAAGRQMTAQQLAQQQGQFNANRSDNYLMGGMGALSGYLQNQGGGQSGASISPAMPDNYWDW